NKVLLPGLIPSSYEWRVKTICLNDGLVSSAYSVTDTFKIRELKFDLGNSNSIEFCLYPVPASEVLHMDLNHLENVTITVSNRLGVVVYKETISDESNNQIDVKQWPPGIYIVKVQDGMNAVEKKIMVL